MFNEEVSQIIDNLKGRRGYEEKKAKKLGFTSLHDYFEDKLQKKQQSINNEKTLAKQALIRNKNLKDNKKSQKNCECC